MYDAAYQISRCHHRGRISWTVLHSRRSQSPWHATKWLGRHTSPLADCGVDKTKQRNSSSDQPFPCAIRDTSGASSLVASKRGSMSN